MSHEEQFEWPSFETVLRAVAPDSPTARSLASADRRAQYSATAKALRTAELADAENEVSVDGEIVVETATEPDNHHDHIDIDHPEPVDASSSTIDITSAGLPEPLQPLDLDTSSIRELLEPRSAEIEVPIAEEALRELDPLPEIDLGTDIASSDEIEDTTSLDPEPASPFDPEPAPNETETENLFEEIEDTTSLDPEPASPFELADSDSLVYDLAEGEIQRVDAANELDSLNAAETHADPFSPDDFGVSEPSGPFAGDHDAHGEKSEYQSPFSDGDDLNRDGTADAFEAPELPESVTSVPGIELPGQDASRVEVFDDLAPMSIEEIDDVPPFEPDDTAFEATFDAPALDLFDLNDDSTIIDEESSEQHEEDVDERPNFDSIAAADEIETDLDQLVDFDQNLMDSDNVIPLRPDIDVAQTSTPTEESPKRVPGPKVTGGTGWVALAPERASQGPDPWADMRPTEEPKKAGFWANRPKFFGGNERRRRKAELRETETEALKPAVDVTFDKDCPRCGSECQVDLDDPIGRRVHVSCPSCQNIWYTPYILEDSQAG